MDFTSLSPDIINMKLNEVRKKSYIKSFIIIEPGLVLTLKKNQLLTEDELVHYQNEFGKDSFKADEVIEEAIK